jgi:hypothetical protein
VLGYCRAHQLVAGDRTICLLYLASAWRAQLRLFHVCIAWQTSALLLNLCG